MAGSLRQITGKPNTWELRVYRGRDSAGKVRHKHVRFHGSRRLAERELARLVAEQNAEPGIVTEERKSWGPTTTINDAIAAWRVNGWQDLSPKTTIRYQDVWDTHIRSSIGRRKIAALGPYDVESYFRELKQRGLSEGSVRMVRAVLHRACRLARRWSGNGLPNPISDTELPTWTLDERNGPVRAPSVKEVTKLLATADANEDIRIAVFLRVLAATGIRRGEACALRWSDFDQPGGTIRINGAVVAAKGGAVLKAPKTRASIRQVACDTETVGALRGLRVEQELLAATCGKTLDDDGFVFSFEPGGSTLPYPDSFSHAMTRIRKEAGLPTDVHLHSLRHFHATALDVVISEAQKRARLGWSTVQMARHYTDGVAEEDRRAAEHVGNLLGSRMSKNTKVRR